VSFSLVRFIRNARDAAPHSLCTDIIGMLVPSVQQIRGLVLNHVFVFPCSDEGPHSMQRRDGEAVQRKLGLYHDRPPVLAILVRSTENPFGYLDGIMTGLLCKRFWSAPIKNPLGRRPDGRSDLHIVDLASAQWKPPIIRVAHD